MAAFQYRHIYHGDAVAIARAQSEASRKRRIRAGRLDADGNPIPKEARAVKAVIEKKPVEVKPEVKVEKGDGRVVVKVQVDFGDRVVDLAYKTNMRGMLMAPQMTVQALEERFAKIVKDNFGLVK